MTEKTALMSGRKRVIRGKSFPYFSVQESQGVSKRDSGGLKTNRRRCYCTQDVNSMVFTSVVTKM